MDTNVVTALISGLCVAVPTIISVIVTANARNAVVEERIKFLTEKFDNLSDRVTKHNQLVERVAIVERDLKTAFNRIDEIREERK